MEGPVCLEYLFSQGKYTVEVGWLKRGGGGAGYPPPPPLLMDAQLRLSLNIHLI